MVWLLRCVVDGGGCVRVAGVVVDVYGDGVGGVRGVVVYVFVGYDVIAVVVVVVVVGCVVVVCGGVVVFCC